MAPLVLDYLKHVCPMLGLIGPADLSLVVHSALGEVAAVLVAVA